jgi:hypothetical protein
MCEKLPTLKISKGKGMHTSLYIYSCRMAKDGIDPELVEQHLKSSSVVCNYKRVVPDREIEAAVEDAYNSVLNLSPRRHVPPLSKYDVSKARDIYNEYSCDVTYLEGNSPEAQPKTVQEALTYLYRPDELICLGLEVNEFHTRPLSYWLGLKYRRLSDFQFIVPNPMSALYGLKKNGEGMSPRSYNNTGPRKFIVCDFDLPCPDIQPSLIVHLAEYCGDMPALVLSSGNKSLHAWWRCDGLSEDRIRQFEDEAASVGADPAILGDARKNQLVRLPMGTRQNNQKKQVVLFWNPNQNQ